MFFSIIQVPYDALIRSHERFKVYANIGLIEIAFRIIVLCILVYYDYDKLILYAGLGFCTSFIIRIIYRVYCRMSFPESKYFFYFEKAYFKKVLSFTGWALYGRLSDMAKTHAITLLLNQMFNPAVVAARAIATNVSTQVQAFSGNFTSSMNPAIIKLYSAGEMDELYRLIYRGAKMSFFLMWVMALPLIVEMPLVLKLWLKNPPPDAAVFARLVLVEALIFAISNPVATAARGPEK